MNLIDIIAANAPWAWIVGGLVLLALELVVPGGYLLWMGVAGILTGLLSIVLPLEWPLQWLIFGILSLVTILAWLRLARRRRAREGEPRLNRRADRYIGHEAVLEQPIAGGFGRLSLDDTVWRIAGPDLPAGTRIRITGSDGAVLHVEAV